MEKTITLECTCDQYQDIETPCCEQFKILLNDCNMHMTYFSSLRVYAIKELGTKKSQDITYCFCCGEKMPKDLYKEWYETLEKEYGLVDPTGKDSSKIPTEFQTDEWWKKRGL